MMGLDSNLQDSGLKWLDRVDKDNAIKVIFATLVFFVFLYLLFFSPPSSFPTNEIVSIGEGATLNEITEILDENEIIRYKPFFKFFVVLSGNQKNLLAGNYIFKKRLGLFGIIWKLSRGEYGFSAVSITFPEGDTVSQMAERLKEKLPGFNEVEFLRLAKEKEGYLFPDTYKFLPEATSEKIIFEMEENFGKKVNPFLFEIKKRGYSLHEVITMASLIEEEARTKETREIISGILWKRLEMDMVLQVDAVFPYIIGKNTFELSLEDLEFDSPYNTYKYRGLPPGPISNPGLSSIEAALRPKESRYLFYLSDRDGNMYYAADFEEHKENKAKYLN